MKEGVVQKRKNYTESFAPDQIFTTNSLIGKMNCSCALLRRKPI